MAVKFSDIDTESYYIGACLKGPEYFKHIPEVWLESDINKKTYKELKKFLEPPYNTYPSIETAFEKIEDIDVKLHLKEVSNIKIVRRDLNVKIYDLFEMYAARKVFQVAESIPNDLEKTKVEEVIRAKIRELSQLVNPFEAGNRERGFIYESAKARWERYRKRESDPNIDRRIPFGIDELDKATGGGPKKGHIVAFFATSGMYKCLTGDSILTDVISGLQYTLKDVVDNKIPVYLYGLDCHKLKLVKVMPDDFVYSGKQKVYEIKTKTGRTIRGPLHHPVYTDSLTWKPISELDSTRDHIGIAGSFPVRDMKFQNIPKYKLGLLAYMIGDGSLKQRSFTNADKEVKADFYNCVSKFLNCKIVNQDGLTDAISSTIIYSREVTAEVIGRLETYRINNFKTLKDFCNKLGVTSGTYIGLRKLTTNISKNRLERYCKNLGVSYNLFDPNNKLEYRDNNILRWFREIDLKICTSPYKVLPNIIFQLDSNYLAYFLGRLWSTDGSIEMKIVKYSSASEQLIDQIQHLLLRLNVMSKKVPFTSRYLDKKIKKKSKEVFKSFNLIITGESALKFHKIVGKFIVGKRKHKSREALSFLRKKFRNPNVNLIPLQAIEAAIGIDNLINEFKGVTDVERPLRNIRYRKKGVSKSFLHRISAKSKYREELLLLIDTDIYWDEFTINYIGERDTYDIQIPLYSSFLANDILVHNTRTKANIAYNAAFISKKDVMVITLEVPKQDYEIIIDSRNNLLDFKDIDTANLGEDRSRYKHSLIKMVEEKPSLYFVDIPGAATTMDLIAESELYYSKYGKYPDEIVLDYVNEIDPVTPWGGTGEKFKNIGVELRRGCRTYDYTLITSLQENREGKKIKDRVKVGTEHIGESNSFQNVCHLIVHLFQDAEGIDESMNILNMSIKKNRYGPKSPAFSVFASGAYNYVGDRKITVGGGGSK